MNALPSFASLRPAGLTAAAIGGVGGSRPPHVSIDQNRFSLVDSTGNVKQIPPLPNPQTGQHEVALDVVFIDANPKPSKIYWGGKEYNPSVTDPPVCFSDNGIAPSSQALTPQNAACATCRHNAIGSAVSKFSGAGIKACQDFKKLAVIIPGDADRMIYLMQIKPGSFKNWSSYINWLKGQKMPAGGSPELYDVVTRMTFESQGVLKFTPTAAVAGNQVLENQIVEAWQKDATKEMTGQLDVPYQGQLAAPAAAPQQILPPPPMQQVVPPFGSVGVVGTVQTPIPTTHTQDSSEPPKRRRRTKAEMEAAQGSPAPFVSGLATAQPHGAPIPADPNDIPPFLRRTPATPAAPPQANTGLAQPAPMPAGLAAELDKAFEFPK